MPVAIILAFPHCLCSSPVTFTSILTKTWPRANKAYCVLRQRASLAGSPAIHRDTRCLLWGVTHFDVARGVKFTCPKRWRIKFQFNDIAGCKKWIFFSLCFSSSRGERYLNQDVAFIFIIWTNFKLLELQRVGNTNWYFVVIPITWRHIPGQKQKSNFAHLSKIP